MKHLVIFLLAINIYSKSIVGTVYDSFTNEVVPNVKIIVNIKDSVLYSDSIGRFSLVTDGSKTKTHIDFLKSGYSEKHINIPNELDSVDIYLVPLSFEYDDITVLDSKANPKHIQTIKESTINNALTKNMSDLLRSSYGINSVEMGEAVSRPVLNGLSGNRLSIVNNNFKSKDLSANSVDHSQAYTLNNAKNISLLYGPDLIRYGSSLVGKSVNTTTNLTIGNKIEANTSLVTSSIASVNEKYSFATKNELNYLFDGLVLNGIYTKANDVNTPERTLLNTSYDLYEVSAATFYQIGEFNVNPYGSIFRKQYGIPGGFVGAHPNGVNIEMLRNSYGVNSEYHLHASIIDKMKFQYERSFYDHKEFENSGLLGAQFRFVSNSARFELLQHQGAILKSGYFGVSVAQKENQLGGFVFIPNNNYFIYSTYLNEEFYLTDKLNIKTGLRYEATKINLDSPYDFDKNIYRNLEFTSFSGSVLFEYKFDDSFDLIACISQSNRAPEPEELFSDGPHLAAYSYDIGNPELKLEKSLSYTLNAVYENEIFRVSSEFFFYDYSNYITPVATGDTNYSTLLPIYRQVNLAADLYGLNLSATADITKEFSVNSNLNYTVGKEAESSGYLPLIPPISTNIDLIYKLTDWEFKISSIFTSSQENIHKFENRTDGYIILNTQAKRNFTIGGSLMTVVASVSNITNTTYRNHLSRIKSVYPQPGVGAEITLNLYF